MERATAALSSNELVLGRYRPLKPLGSGSSGSVWLARDERTGLDVALKIVQREGKAGDRAEREAGAAARLRHPRCQRIYEHAGDGRHVYIAYEYVPGSTLREANRAGKLSDGESVEAAAQVLEGLAHAHGRGIVHRDVKPANVLLADGPEVSVRLLDFGLARFAQADTLTAVGDVPGTLAYISPERLRGEAASPASDVWSVGVMLWELLAGRHPFWAPSLLATSKKIESGAPPLQKARPDLPRALVVAVERALDPDPIRRPPAGELAKRLRLARKAAPVPAARALRPAKSPVSPVARVLPALLAAVFAGWTASTLPFYPSTWPVGLALLAAVLTAFSARGGLAFALFVPVFPLGNISMGLALLYGGLAALWFILHIRDPRAGFAFALGPLLAPIAALGLLPLALQPVRNGFRRALQAVAAVLMAGIVAGLQHVALPFAAGRAGSLGLDGDRSPVHAASVLGHALFAHPTLALEALVLAAAAALLPFARGRGLWGIAVFGAGLIAASVLAAPHADPIPPVVTAWATCIALVVWERRRLLFPRARPHSPRLETLD
ncbi:MAG TPA: serine/threonine-protein kinase [Gaiellaceae bacterium]